MKRISLTDENRAGVPGCFRRSVPSEARLKAGVRDVPEELGEHSPGSENRTRFDRLEPGVLTVTTMPSEARALMGDTALLLLFGLRRAIGVSSDESMAVLEIELWSTCGSWLIKVNQLVGLGSRVNSRYQYELQMFIWPVQRPAAVSL